MEGVLNIILEIEQIQFVKLSSQTNLNLQFFELFVILTEQTVLNPKVQ